MRKFVMLRRQECRSYVKERETNNTAEEGISIPLRLRELCGRCACEGDIGGRLVDSSSSKRSLTPSTEPERQRSKP